MADEMTLEIEGFDELLQRIAELEQGSGPFTAMIESTMLSALATLEGAIKARTPVNSGLLRGSVTSVMYGVPVAYGRSIEGAVGTPISYGAPVEYGRAAGKMPPVDAIELWVKRKGIASEGKERNVAFLIARAIGRRGTEGAYMFRDGFEAARPNIEKGFDRLLQQIVEGLAQ